MITEQKEVWRNCNRTAQSQRFYTMERGSKHCKYQVWFTCWTESVFRDDTKSVHVSVVRSVCSVMCLWPLLCIFWFYCVVNKIQTIKNPIFSIPSHSFLPASQSQSHWWAIRGGPFVSQVWISKYSWPLSLPRLRLSNTKHVLQNLNQYIVFCEWFSRMIFILK